MHVIAIVYQLEMLIIKSFNIYRLLFIISADFSRNPQPLSIFGKSLCGIIDEYHTLKDAERQVWNFKNRKHGRYQKFLTMWKTLENAIATIK